jgi:hypothetical protein
MRTRHQNGWLEETKAGTWRAHWIEYVRDPGTDKDRRRHHSKVLGEKNKMRKFEAREALNKIVSPLNATQTSRRDDRVSLRWFVDNRWRSIVEGNWGPTTRKTNEHFIRVILGRFGDKPLREYDGIARMDETQILASASVAGGVQ